LSQTSAWLYYSTLASAIEESSDRLGEQKTGYAKTVATHRGDEIASESEIEDERTLRGRLSSAYVTESREAIPPDAEDELWVTRGLGPKVVNSLLKAWTTMDRQQIVENGNLSRIQTKPSYQKAVGDLIRNCLKADHNAQSRSHLGSAMLADSAMNQAGRKTKVQTRFFHSQASCH
jgi:hypothetical protein